MATHVAFLRGVNVGGVRMKMAAVAAVFVDAGMEDVRTILASGNVVFRSPSRSSAKLKARLEEALSEAFDYEAHLILVSAAELTSIIEGFPFEDRAPEWQPNVIFVSSVARSKELLQFAADSQSPQDRVEAGKKCLYWEVRKGSSTGSPFAKELGRGKNRVATTTRNLRTLLKVQVAARESW